MHVQYDEYELLEIFESEPEDFITPGAGVYRYCKMDTLGFKLNMIVSYYEDTVQLDIVYKERYIFETKMESVKRIYTRNDSLYIQGTEEKKKIEVKFKPHFTVKIEEF